MTRPPLTAKVLARFWSKVNMIEDEESCWLWTGSLRNGYGQLYVAEGKIEYTHRISWQLHNGDISDSLMVLHKCDNRACVRPEHLFLGTQLENMEDMTSKGRHHDARGEGNGFAKATNATVLQMRALYATNEYSIRELAAKFGLSYTASRAIVRRQAWAHL